MSDGQTTEAVLRLVVQGQEQLDAAVKLMRNLQNESGNFSRTTEKTIKDTEGLGLAMGGLRTQLEGVQKGMVGVAAASTSQSWTDLKTKVLGAADAYRTLNQAQLAAGKAPLSQAAFLHSSQNTTGATATDLASYAAGANMSLFDKAANNNLPRLRYALYDVSTTATTTGIAVGAIGAYAIKASTDFDRAFADVRRTMNDISDGAALKLKNQLIELTRTVPLSFAEIAKIATLGNQLGVSQQNLLSFTETIAKFSAVSGISADESAKSFGTLGSILGFTENQYSNFASSVELVGRTSAATDSDILSMTKDIGQQAHQAGFTADQVIALSGTFAQLRVAPERARGSITTYFSTLNKAIAGGGKGLQEFSLITGIAADKLSNMVKGGQGVQVFQAFLNGLHNKDNIVEVTKALDDLGLKQLRVSDAFERLSSNQQVFTQYMALAKQGYVQNTELNRQYAIVLDTVASKWQEFLNAIKEFAAAAGDTLGPAIGNILTDLTRFLNMLTDFSKTPFGKSVVELTSIIAGLITVLLGAAGASAVAGASFLAIKTALTEIGITAGGASAGLNVTAGSLLATGSAAEGASVGLRIFRAALVATGVGALLVGLGYGIQLLTDFGSAMKEIQGPGNFFIDLVNDSAIAVDGLISSVLNAASIVSRFIGGLPGGGAFKDWANGLTDLANSYTKTGNAIDASGKQAHASWNQWVADQNKVADSSKTALPPVQNYAGNVDALNKKLYDNLNASNQAVSGTNNVAKSASSAAAQVRTLVDYANDLSGVFTRSFDLRFGGQQGMDKITTAWQTMRQNIDDAKKSLDQLRASQAQLLADKAVKEYWLTVANSYGDSVRAGSLKADISSDNSKIADGNAQISDAQAKMSTTLQGNSKAAIDNRNSILGLVQSYEDLIKQYASSGLTQDQLKVKVGQLKQQFIEQATQLGFSRGDVEKYTGAFDDMSLAIGRVPRNITVTANTNPALQALAEFQDKLKAAAKGVKVPITAAVNNDSLAKFARGQGIVAQISSLQGQLLPSASTDSQISRNQSIQSQINALTKKINSGNYYTGGYTGPGGMFDIAGNVHGGEFVFNKVATDFYGPSFLNRVMVAGQRGGSGALGGSGSGTVGLDDATIYKLADAFARRMPDLSISAASLGSAVRAAAMADNNLRRY